jgi:hypothetical protein
MQSLTRWSSTSRCSDIMQYVAQGKHNAELVECFWVSHLTTMAARRCWERVCSAGHCTVCDTVGDTVQPVTAVLHQQGWCSHLHCFGGLGVGRLRAARMHQRPRPCTPALVGGPTLVDSMHHPALWIHLNTSRSDPYVQPRHSCTPAFPYDNPALQAHTF